MAGWCENKSKFFWAVWKGSRKNLSSSFKFTFRALRNLRRCFVVNPICVQSRWVLDLHWVIPILTIVAVYLSIPVNNQRRTIHRVPPLFIPKVLRKDRRWFSGPLSTDRQSFLTAHHSFPSLPSYLLRIWQQDTWCLLYCCERTSVDLCLLKPNENVDACAIYPEPERTFATLRTREIRPQGCCTSLRATEMGKWQKSVVTENSRNETVAHVY